jgi:DNA-binding MarR family transcriptional regulator
MNGGVDEREWKVIEALQKHPRGVGLNALYRECSDYMAKPTLSKIVGELERKGLVNVVRGRRGQRSVITLTEKASPLIRMLKKLAKLEDSASSYIRSLRLNLETGVEDPVKVEEIFLKQLKEIMDTLGGVIVAPIVGGYSKEVRDYVVSRVLDTITRLVGDAFSLMDVLDRLKEAKGTPSHQPQESQSQIQSAS